MTQVCCHGDMVSSSSTSQPKMLLYIRDKDRVKSWRKKYTCKKFRKKGGKQIQPSGIVCPSQRQCEFHLGFADLSPASSPIPVMQKGKPTHAQLPHIRASESPSFDAASAKLSHFEIQNCHKTSHCVTFALVSFAFETGLSGKHNQMEHTHVFEKCASASNEQWHCNLLKQTVTSDSMQVSKVINCLIWSTWSSEFCVIWKQLWWSLITCKGRWFCHNQQKGEKLFWNNDSAIGAGSQESSNAEKQENFDALESATVLETIDALDSVTCLTKNAQMWVEWNTTKKWCIIEFVFWNFEILHVCAHAWRKHSTGCFVKNGMEMSSNSSSKGKTRTTARLKDRKSCPVTKCVVLFLWFCEVAKLVVENEWWSRVLSDLAFTLVAKVHDLTFTLTLSFEHGPVLSFQKKAAWQKHEKLSEWKWNGKIGWIN